MKFIIFFFLLFITSCANQKTVLICGDHRCINKAEANQYFEENLSIEVQIFSEDKKTSFNLVEINTKDGSSNIKVFKNNNNKIVKKLSKEEIKEKKAEIAKKTQSKSKKIAKKRKKKSQLATKDIEKKQLKLKKTTNQIISNNSIDICLKVKKCDIDSIANYLIKLSNEKDFPNISLRE